MRQCPRQERRCQWTPVARRLGLARKPTKDLRATQHPSSSRRQLNPARLGPPRLHQPLRIDLRSDRRQTYQESLLGRAGTPMKPACRGRKTQRLPPGRCRGRTSLCPGLKTRARPRRTRTSRCRSTSSSLEDWLASSWTRRPIVIRQSTPSFSLPWWLSSAAGPLRTTAVSQR